MDKRKRLNNIFLSASIPHPKRNKYFYETADIMAIRDAVKALATVAIPKANLIWGGHPSITPLIRHVLEKMDTKIEDHVTLFQSLYFENNFPKENKTFENIKLVTSLDTQEASINYMREKMIFENDFKAGIFIGGMEGILIEYAYFRIAHPNALVLPIASTGGAASFIYNEFKGQYDTKLKNDYAYMALFRDLLKEFI